MLLMENIGLEVMILLFAAMLSFVVAKRIGQSAVLGMILIGIILGPTVLGLVEYSEAIQVLVHVYVWPAGIAEHQQFAVQVDVH